MATQELDVGTVAVNRARDPIFARPAVADDQHFAVKLGGVLHPRKHILHLFVAVAQAGTLLDFGQQVIALLAQPAGVL